jgi:hypothetical protein
VGSTPSVGTNDDQGEPTPARIWWFQGGRPRQALSAGRTTATKQEHSNESQNFRENFARSDRLFAASQGLAALFHNCNREGVGKDLKLRPDQRVLFAQSVGYPA